MMSPSTPSARGRTSPGATRTLIWVVGAAVVAFLAGFAWQYVRAERIGRDAESVTQALHAARLEATIGEAVIRAQGGEYELARQRASAFYSGLQSRLTPALDGEARTVARALLAGRDPVITTLARRDPASASVLAQVLTRYREVVRRASLDSVPPSRDPD